MRSRPKLGQLLLEAGLLTSSQLEQAIKYRDRNGMKLGQILSRMGLVTEDKLVAVLSEQLRVPRYRADTYPMDLDLANYVPSDLAQRLNVVPLRKQHKVLDLGMCDPTDLDACDTVEQLCHLEVQPVICTVREMNQVTRALYGSFAGLGHVLGRADTADLAESDPKASGADDIEVGALADMAEDAPVVRMVNWIIAQGVREGASDIHISPEADHLQLRFRLDGKLREVPAPSKSLHLSIVSRIKILSSMDIAISHIPQDGRMTAHVDNREINVRVSTIPTTHGENVVMRLLDMSAFDYTLNDLGMEERDRDLLLQVLKQPHGMILSTGPTGSGKTTTLYAMLKEVNRPDVNIITVEDPVEYRIPKIRQLQLNTRAGMTFASGLRSILRQDPDVIMVGEIRDAETARIAVQAALTGHRVFSTVHTNDAAGAITRLIDMGIEPFLVSSVLLLSFAQRLIRRVCKYCHESELATDESLAFWGLPPNQDIAFKKAVGCPRCMHTGYQGRVGIFEVMLINDTIKEMIAKQQTTLAIKDAARETGLFHTLKEDAAEKVRLGLTTPEEALSVVPL